MLRSLARVLPLLLLAMLGGEAHAGDAEIRALWSELDAAWNARDVERFSALYTDDASLLFIDGGQSLEGRVTIHANFSEQFARTPPGLSHHTTLGGIRPVADGIALADGAVEIHRAEPGTQDTPVVVRRFAIFALMRDAGRTWRIDTLRVYPLGDAP